jgi:hypothetical protein
VYSYYNILLYLREGVSPPTPPLRPPSLFTCHVLRVASRGLHVLPGDYCAVVASYLSILRCLRHTPHLSSTPSASSVSVLRQAQIRALASVCLFLPRSILSLPLSTFASIYSIYAIYTASSTSTTAALCAQQAHYRP